MSDLVLIVAGTAGYIGCLVLAWRSERHLTIAVVGLILSALILGSALERTLP